MLRLNIIGVKEIVARGKLLSGQDPNYFDRGDKIC